MSAAPPIRPFVQATAWIVIAAMLLPTLVACTTVPASAPSTPTPTGAPDVARLDGIVVDGSRVAQGREPGLIVVTRDGQRGDGYAGLELKRGDRIETGPRAHAVIRYPSGTEVLMRPNSGARVGSLTDFFGEAFVKVRGIFSVDTTFVTAGARGTAYLVRTYAGGTTGVTVVDGVVEVGSTTGAWPSLAIGAGTTTLAYPRAPQPAAASLEELARTRDWVERVEQLVPPPRSGPSAGTVVGAVAIAAVIAALVASSDHDKPRETTPPARDRPPPREPTPHEPPPPPRLELPRAISPGTVQGPGPTLDCRRGVTLRWSAVAGARDYVVAMTVQSERSWQPARVAPTAATQATIAAPSLAYANRWSVYARAANEGPPSPTLYFRCDFSGVR
ncbi:MAG TPA: FecR domain-containing protein [Caldimonas sp.]